MSLPYSTKISIHISITKTPSNQAQAKSKENSVVVRELHLKEREKIFHENETRKLKANPSNPFLTLNSRVSGFKSIYQYLSMKGDDEKFIMSSERCSLANIDRLMLFSKIFHHRLSTSSLSLSSSWWDY